jgi:hypothetical protein
VASGGDPQTWTRGETPSRSSSRQGTNPAECLSQDELVAKALAFTTKNPTFASTTQATNSKYSTPTKAKKTGGASLKRSTQAKKSSSKKETKRVDRAVSPSNFRTKGNSSNHSN